MKILTYTIEHPGDDGILPFTETVAVVVESGNLGEGFAGYMQHCLESFYDGAKVKAT